jgi:hypothetical protein
MGNVEQKMLASKAPNDFRHGGRSPPDFILISNALTSYGNDRRLAMLTNGVDVPVSGAGNGRLISFLDDGA